MTPEERIRDLGLELPPAPAPVASYVTFAQTGNLVYTSGHGPLRADGSWILGKVGTDIDLDTAREAARITGLAILSTLRHHLGSLDRVNRIVKVLGMVNCHRTFTDHPAVINACSDLFVEVFGEAGRHARSAVGVSSLPMGISVEIEAIVEVD